LMVNTSARCSFVTVKLSPPLLHPLFYFSSLLYTT
jgi:hypothetical protein